MQGREKVPKRLFTKEMLQWQKAYKGMQKIAKVTSQIGARDILKRALFGMKGMLNNLPRERTKELAQQPEGESQGEEME